MILFDRLVDSVLGTTEDYAPLRTVVEKEILHHDILRILSEEGILKSLVFIGGTCLRACYGSNRLSEDLDFTYVNNLNGQVFQDLPEFIKEAFLRKYDLPVQVHIPLEDSGLVKTWKILVQTRPEKHLPAQRIHIDINNMPSYDFGPRMLINHYSFDPGTSGLIIQAESRQEILTDKFLALGLRLNRIKNRDLWDIVWLKQQGIEPDREILLKKLKNYGIPFLKYRDSMLQRLNSLTDDPVIYKAFIMEMSRFLPNRIVKETVESVDFWEYLKTLVSETWTDLDGGSRTSYGFSM